MYQRSGAPSKDDILAARDRILKRYPRLRVIGCHLGSNEDDLDKLTKRLDTYPNFAVDLASRVRNLVRGDRQKVRQFLNKFQDRIIYATDFTLGPDELPPGARSDGDLTGRRDGATRPTCRPAWGIRSSTQVPSQ
jgi:hypothetical protein